MLDQNMCWHIGEGVIYSRYLTDQSISLNIKNKAFRIVSLVAVQTRPEINRANACNSTNKLDKN